jgi:hypothetical protein
MRCPRCRQAFRHERPRESDAALSVAEEDLPDETEETTGAPEADPPAKRRKKKRSKQKPQAAPKGLLVGLAIGGVLLLGGLLVAAVWILSRGEEVIIAKPTVEYVAPGAFRCKYPEGWKVETYGEHPLYVLTCRSGDAEFSIRSNHAFSTLEDAALTGRPKFITDPKAAMLHAHEADKARAAAEIGRGYREEGEVEYLLGVCPRSRFVARGGLLGTPMRGYRMTVVAFPMQLSVTCQCKDSDWERLRPIFDEALASVRAGS